MILLLWMKPSNNAAGLVAAKLTTAVTRTVATTTGVRRNA